MPCRLTLMNERNRYSPTDALSGRIKSKFNGLPLVTGWKERGVMPLSLSLSLFDPAQASGIHIPETRPGEPTIHTATRLFINASANYPASVVAQAALIMLACRASQLNPDILKNALLTDEEQIARLTRLANSRHREAIPKKQFTVTSTNASVTIENDFELAEAMMG